VGVDTFRFSAREVGQLVVYLERNPQVTDVLITGGDPLVMSAGALASYLVPLLERRFRNLRTIRIGTKVLSHWPYRFLTDHDADDLLKLFQLVATYGKNVAIMAHFNHPRELQTDAAKQAIERILETGTCIRTQSPLLAGINDDPTLWARLWREQVGLGCVPYYMFVMRNTGAQSYFGVPLVQAWRIFRQAYQTVSGLARTVRGPVMSAHPGKCQVLGESRINGESVLVLYFLQGRNPDWVSRPFFARYDPQALWLTDLEPAFGAEKFFFE
jgi:L-lysine 2,3-aminomutase